MEIRFGNNDYVIDLESGDHPRECHVPLYYPMRPMESVDGAESPTQKQDGPGTKGNV